MLFALVTITPAAWILVVDVGYKSGDLFLHLSLKLVVGVVGSHFVMERPSQVKFNRFRFIVADLGCFWIVQGTLSRLVKLIGWLRLSNCPSELVPDYSWLFKHYFILALECLLQQESILSY